MTAPAASSGTTLAADGLVPSVESALELAAEGFRVFPCHTPMPNECSCGAGCASPGKHPRTLHGCRDATADRTMIEAWWDRWPDANVGVATGEELHVLDIDGHHAQAKLDALCREHGSLPPTRAVRTGREGGRHLWFRPPAGALPGRRLAQGIDTRGEGGYVLAPPSLHKSKRTYEWEIPDATVATLPAWSVERLSLPRTAATSGNAGLAGKRPQARDAAWHRRLEALGRQVLDDEMSILAAHSREPETGRGTALYGAAAHLGRIVGAGGLSLSATWQELEAAGRRLGLGEDELKRSVERGLQEGMAEPLTPDLLPDRPRPAGPGQQLTGTNGSSPSGGGPGKAPVDQEPRDPASGDVWPLLPRPVPPPFPVEALGEEIAAFVNALATQTQTAPDLAALGVLGVLSSVALTAKVDCGNWEEETLALYILIVSPSGDRKSTVLKKVAAPLYRIEHEALQEAKVKKLEHESRREMLQARKKTLTTRAGKIDDEDGWASTQADLEQVSAELAEAAEFVEPRLLTDDATPEGLAGLLADHETGIAVLSAESAVIDNLLGHYSDKGKANLHVVCKAYNAERAYVDRRGTAALIIPRPLLGITLFSQPFVLEHVLAHGTARGQGLIGRFILVDASAASYVGRRQIEPPPAAVPQYLHEAWERIVQRVRCANDATQPTKGDSEHSKGGFVGSVASEDVRLLTLSLSPSSKKLLTELEVSLEPRQADGADLATYRDWVSRHHGRVARTAGLLHLAERPPDQPIPVDTMQRALRIGDYFLEHGQLALSTPDQHQRRALAWLSRQEEHIVSQRDIHHGPLGGHVKVEKAATLAEALVDAGALRPVIGGEEPPSPKGGRPKGPRYEINPHLRT